MKRAWGTDRAGARGAPQRQRVIELRRRTRRGAGFIAHVCAMHASTVHRICVQAGLGRLDRGDRSTGPPPKPLRYEREKPGELMSTSKLPAIPDGGGWRTHGRGNAGPRQRAGWRYVHSAIDDRTRLGYSEIHTNETGFTAAGFWRRAAAFYALAGISCERVPPTTAPATAPTSSPRSKTPAPAVGARPPAPDQRQSRTFPPHPREEWAYASDWDNDDAHQPSCTTEHRPHGAWDTPMATLTRLSGDNVLGMHI